MKIVFDTETTGLNPNVDEILQLAIIDEDGNTLFNQYFKPETVTDWPDAEQVHHISKDMVKDCKPISFYRDEIQAIIDKADCYISYNGAFDERFLYAAFIELKEYAEGVDVMSVFAPIYGEWSEFFGNYKWQKLTTCAAYYNYHWPDNAHNALADCQATLYCYKCMQKQKEMNSKCIMPEQPYSDICPHSILDFPSEEDPSNFEVYCKIGAKDCGCKYGV